MTASTPPLPSDAALAAVEGLLPQLAALADLFRAIADADTHSKLIAELRAASANARSEVAKAIKAAGELEDKRKAHDEAIARELSEHRNKLQVERDDQAAVWASQRKELDGERKQLEEERKRLEADRSAHEAAKAALDRKIAAVRALSG